MTSTLQTTPLDLQVRLQLTQLLDHVKQNPDQWVSINGQMYEYHPPAINERLVPIIKPIFQLSPNRKVIMMRISGDAKDYKYNFDAGDLILIEGQGYSIHHDGRSVALPLQEMGHILGQITIQVDNECTLYLLWIVKST